MEKLLIDGMHGLGDNIYARPIIRELLQKWDVHLMTPWPELYSDLDVKFVDPGTQLRTQKANVASTKMEWTPKPHPITTVRLRYGRGLEHSSVINMLAEPFGFNPNKLKLDLPRIGNHPVPRGKPIVLVRPVTVRREWANHARNPLPEYVAWAASQFMDRYTVVSVADLQAGEEWALEPLPPAHYTYHAGELGITDLISLVWDCEAMIGGVGWVVPAAIASGTPLFCILGGNGGHNAPERLAHPSWNTYHIGWAVPDSFCKCTGMAHECDKKISDLNYWFRRWSYVG